MKPSYFKLDAPLASDHERRRPCLALIEGRDALIRDAKESATGNEVQRGAQRWMWPGPGDLENARIGGRLSTKTVYDVKLKLATLDNVWERSLAEVAAEPFAHEPTFENWPPPLVSYEEVKGRDGEKPLRRLSPDSGVQRLGADGESLLDIWRQSFYLKQGLGVHYRLIDMPEQAGGSPYWVGVAPPQVTRIVAPRAGSIGPREVAIRLPAGSAEDGPVADPEKLPEPPDYSKDSAWWVRVYRTSAYNGGTEDGPVLFRHVAKVKDKDRWVEPDWIPLESSGTTMTEIPLVPFYGRRVGVLRGWPEFEDAASIQMDLWRSMTDYNLRKLNDYINLLVVSGAKQSEIEQSGRLICLPEKGTAQQIETTGAAQSAAREDHEVLRHRIRWSMMRKIQQAQPQAQQTATEIRADVRGAGSWLEAQVLMDLASVAQGLRWHAQLANLDGSRGTVDLYHDFTAAPGAMDRLERIYLGSEGRLCPPGLFWRENHRRSGISGKEDPTDIASEVSKNMERDRAL